MKIISQRSWLSAMLAFLRDYIKHGIPLFTTGKPKESRQKMKTPNLEPRIINLDLNYANKLLGMNFSRNDVKKLLEKMHYGIKFKDDNISILIPAYRTDILHQIDLVEDIAISYGYENFKPELPKIATTGRRDHFEKFSGNIRELMIGFGFQEVMTLVMTNRENLFNRMNLPDNGVAEAGNPLSPEHTVARNWLLPSLMSFLEKNKKKGYPQKIFETGDCILRDGNNISNFSGVIAHSRTNFSEIKAVVAGIFEDMKLTPRIEKYDHKSFINGRCGGTEFGFFGEINPQVLENFGIEVPVTAFEFDLNLIFKR